MRVFKHPSYNYMTVVEIPKDELGKVNMAHCKEPRETLKHFYDRQEIKPDFLINGGFFNMSDGTTCFNFIDEGEGIVTGHWHTKGMGVVGDAKLIYADMNSRPDWRDFVAAYPPLIENGVAHPVTIASEINYKARRSAIGYNEQNIYLVAVESPGMTFGMLQNALLALGVTYAINLDGGGSTKILQNGKSITSTLYNRAVDNVIAVYLKKKTIYRVQLGAFTKEQYAIALRDEIRALPDTINAGYKDAYVRKIGKYHKVQVGAFSKHENAMRVLDDLRARGFEAFITTEQ